MVRPRISDAIAMNDAQLQATIDAAWEARDTVGIATKGPSRDAVDGALAALDAGRLRVAEKRDGRWHVHQWLKKAVLLSFRLNDMIQIAGGPVDPGEGGAAWWDKVPSKFAGWGANRFRAAGSPDSSRRSRGGSSAGAGRPRGVGAREARRGRRPPGASRGRSLYCAVIVKRVDEKTRAKTSINELLRD